jgi:transcriptional antiterminator RfaH
MEYWSTPCWYVAHTHPRQEERANHNLLAWGVETFTPKMKVIKYKAFTGEPAVLIKPLFPRYIFARFKLSDLYYKIRFTRGIHSLVSFMDKPCPVDDELIDLIKSRIDDKGFVRTVDQLKIGDEVMIKEGVLKNFSGIFVCEMKDEDRIRILLRTVNYQAHVVIERGKVSKLGGEHCVPL